MVPKEWQRPLSTYFGLLDSRTSDTLKIIGAGSVVSILWLQMSQDSIKLQHVISFVPTTPAVGSL